MSEPLNTGGKPICYFFLRYYLMWALHGGLKSGQFVYQKNKLSQY